MRRSALLLAALAVSLAAAFAVGVARGAPLPPPPMNTPLYVSIGDGQATEGTLGVMKITAWGLLPAGKTADIYWSTTGGGTGTVGFDYLAQSGEYEMATGSVNCMVGSVNDSIYEPNRTFKVHIWSPDQFVVITRSTGTFTILDNDPIPTVSIGDAGTVTEGSALTFPITLSNPSYLPISVNVNPHAAGTSANWDANDVAASPAAGANIAAYGTGGSFVIQTNDDNVYEGSETVKAALTGATNATIGTATGTGVVNDNDPMPVVNIADASPFTVHHGHILNFALTLTGQSQLPVTVSLERYLNLSLSGTATVSFAPLVTTATYSYTVPSLVVAATRVHLTGATNATLPGGSANWAYGLGIW